MFKRVMVAVVGIPFLILVLGVAPEWAAMVLVCGMCAVGAWELMHAVAGKAGQALTPLAVLSAALVPVCVYLEMSVETAELTALPELPLHCSWCLSAVTAVNGPCPLLPSLPRFLRGWCSR